MDFFHDLFSIEGIKEIIRWGGLLILIAIVFSETGLLVGFFLPGDSLLFTAGVVAATTDTLQLWQLLAGLTLASICGDSVNYMIGKRAGNALYSREQSRWFRRDHLLKARAFYEKYGPMTIILAKFMPFVRTFAPCVAGVAEMPYRRFLPFSMAGAFLWVWSMTLAGYYLGQIPWVAQNLEKVVLLIVFCSVAPVAVHALRKRRV